MRGRPGRTAIPVLALGFVLMLGSAGVAVAGTGGPETARADRQESWRTDDHVSDHASGEGNGGQGTGHGDGGWSNDDHGKPGDGKPGNGGDGAGSGSGSGTGSGSGSGGGVSGQSDGGTDTPAVPVPTVPPALPAVVPSVPSVVVPAPTVADIAPQVDAESATVAGASAVAPTDAAAALPDLSGLAGLGNLAVTAPAAETSPGGLLPAAREVLNTPEARSLAAVLAIALAVLLFLALQGLFDRGEPKLAGVRDDRDVARFR